MPGSVPLRASPSRSPSHPSAVRFVKYPAAGQPRDVHAGPIRFLTWRPSGAGTSHTRCRPGVLIGGTR